MNDPGIFTDGLKPTRMAEARIEAHNAAHWLARLSRSYAKIAPRRAEPLLYWDQARAVIVTPELADGLRVELDFPTLAFQFTEDGAPSPHVLDLDGVSPAEVEAWVLIETLHRGMDRGAFSKDLPYRPDVLMEGDEVRYHSEDFKNEFGALTEAQKHGALVLEAVRDAFFPALDAADRSSQLTVWPERLETGFLLPIKNGATAEALRVGFSFGGQQAFSPMFFIRYIGADLRVSPLTDRLIPLNDDGALKRSAARIAESLITQIRAALAIVERASASPSGDDDGAADAMTSL